MADIVLSDIESAIDWWRGRAPSPDGVTLAPPLAALAEVLAPMARARLAAVDEDALPPAARQAWLAWYAQTPDSPCIAICSTAQGDAVCKGCGRSEAEVQDWPALSPAHKRAVWHRISAEGSAWRFNRYAERARQSRP